MKKYKILILGITGLIGYNLFSYFTNKNYLVYGVLRNKHKFNKIYNINTVFEIEGFDSFKHIFDNIKPDLVVNCIGITKHNPLIKEPLSFIPINSYLPHFLNSLCEVFRARFLHISTDCVFSGGRGYYSEIDIPDAADFYGLSKYLGEPKSGCYITLRTSTIGSELASSNGLLNWFLGQHGSCQGFKNAFFSGISARELGNVIEQYVIPNPQLHGLYHLGASRISKFDLLNEIAYEYKKNIEIIPNFEFKIDRSLNSNRFYLATGYKPPSWSQMINEMHLCK